MMPEPHRLIGLPAGTVDRVTHEINFVLAVADREPIAFVVEFGPAAQVVSALGRMLSELRRILMTSQTSKSIVAEKVASSHVQKDSWENLVIMQLMTPQGTPYTFALPPQDAAEIANQLRTESAKPHQVGSA
jgi:hypothetical protein